MTSLGEGLQLVTESGRNAALLEVEVRLLTLPNSDPQEWLEAVDKLVPSLANKGGAIKRGEGIYSLSDCDRSPTALWGEGESASCSATWDEIMERTYIQLEEIGADSVAAVTDGVEGVDGVDYRSSNSGSNTDTSSIGADKPRTAAKNITDHSSWDRYLSLIQGRTSYAPIKFNGQTFLSNQAGHGWDYRMWGTGYWWQGTRHPYYNVLYAGDVDTMRAFLDFYVRMLPYAQARSHIQFEGTPAGGVLSGEAVLFEEVTTQFGTYQEANWGCNHSNVTDDNAEIVGDAPLRPPRPYGASENHFIRWHFTGSLEMSLMALDLYDVTRSDSDLEVYLPLVSAVVEGYRQRFPHTNATTGKIDFWPSQALETWECQNFTGGAENGGRTGVRALHALNRARANATVQRESILVCCVELFYLERVCFICVLMCARACV
jgi:hypothetical protein